MDNATCSVDGCTRPLRVKARRLCNTHYQADLRAKGKGRTLYMVTCDGCGKEFGSTRLDGKLCSDECRALTYLGQEREKRVTQLPMDHPVRESMRREGWERHRMASLAARSDFRVAFEEGDYPAIIEAVRQRSTLVDDGCWVWGCRNRDGYPTHRFGRRTVLVHRLVVEAKYGAPLGKQAAHHACANTMCVNPDHLQPVTARENAAEMLARTYMETRIADLESALAHLDHTHPLLAEVGVVRAS